jgi:hypothetical protein
MGNPRDRRTEIPEPAMPNEAELLAVMEQSDREAAAGLTVPLAEVLAELDEAVISIEARRRDRRA